MLISVLNRCPLSKNIGTLFVKIGQNGEIQCFRYGRQPGNMAWPITQES